jgi:hypothetical protein
MLEQLRIAYDRDGLDGVHRLLHRRKVQRERRPKKELPPPKMPPFNFGQRTSLTELRPRHLLMVEEYGHQLEYDRNALREYFTVNWYRLFGPLRKSKAREVPSDQLRKELMVSRLLDLIEMRRDEYAAERSEKLTSNIKSSPAGCTPGLMTATGEADTLSRRYTF